MIAFVLFRIMVRFALRWFAYLIFFSVWKVNALFIGGGRLQWGSDFEIILIFKEAFPKK